MTDCAASPATMSLHTEINFEAQGAAVELPQERRTALISAAVTGQMDARYHRENAA